MRNPAGPPGEAVAKAAASSLSGRWREDLPLRPGERMSATPRLIGLLLVLSLAAGCGAPRQAGFEREVVGAARHKDADGNYPFVVAPVTRDTLPRYAAWPRIGEDGHPWIRRQKQPASAIIAPGDRIDLAIWDTGENSLLVSSGSRMVDLHDLAVDSSGKVFLPYVGEMRIAGMSPNNARSAIETRVVEVLPSAQVQLSMKPGRENSVSLVGGVGSPGSYPLPDRDVTLLTLLSLGGGVSKSLTNPQVTLVRNDHIYRTSVQSIYDAPQLDTTLEGGDRVIVDEEKRSFLVLGAAGRQSVHLFPKDRLSALEALALMGGVDGSRANPQGVLILRQYPAQAVRQDGKGPAQERVVFSLDLTSADGLFSAGRFAIAPGDLIYATESPVNVARTISGIFGNLIGLGSRVSNLTN